MTREEAIFCEKSYIGETDCRNCNYTDTCKSRESHKMAIKALEQEPKWIPCSERTPEDRREVLVTAYWHETYQVMMASYFGDGLWWCVPFNNSGEHMQRLKPKAWMPLPERYKEKTKDEELGR